MLKVTHDLVGILRESIDANVYLVTLVVASVAPVSYPKVN